MALTLRKRVDRLHEAAVRKLIDAHKADREEPLVLAIRFPGEVIDDIYLFEVVEGFPGSDDEEFMEMKFEPSANLRTLGDFHLVLGSPAQLLAAIKRKDPILRKIRKGKTLFNEHKQADGLLKALEL